MKETRLSSGRARSEARFTAAPARADLPADYSALLDDLKKRIAGERLRIILSANAAMILLYWDIGRSILERQAKEGWGTRVIDRLSNDLREAFPDMKGLSPRNLKYMRAFAEAWPDRAIVQQLAAQIPWFHNCLILDKLTDTETRKWYIKTTIEQGWSRNILAMQIESGFHERQGRAITNFPATLPPVDSDLAAQVFKDPYLFDFIGTADPRREQEVEEQDFYLDLLFYHVRLRCYVVVELKAVPFDPAFIGQLNLYLSAVDDLMHRSDDKPTIGLLLCRAKKKLVVEYALRDLKKPVGVATWQTRIVKSLPKEFKGILPSVEDIEKEFAL